MSLIEDKFTKGFDEPTRRYRKALLATSALIVAVWFLDLRISLPIQVLGLKLVAKDPTFFESKLSLIAITLIGYFLAMFLSHRRPGDTLADHRHESLAFEGHRLGEAPSVSRNQHCRH